ncbi:MAG: DUF502 domain-containing protein [Chloroflexota bacterium]
MARPRRRGPFRAIAAHFQRTLGAGILVVLPIAITVLVLTFIVDLLDPLLGKTALKFAPVPEIPGLGVAALLVLVYLAGLIATQVLGRRLIRLGHRAMEVIPVVRIIYATARSAVELLSSSPDKQQLYSGVVLIDFPRVGMKSIGLVTARLGVINGEETLAVYVPTTPTPFSGFLVMVPAKDTTPTDMSVEDAMKIVISGGIMGAEAFTSSAQGDGVAARPAQAVTDQVQRPSS